MRTLVILRLAILTVMLGLTLGGCTKCGWIWDNGPSSCRADVPVH
jgi:hypothetical protein